MKYIYLIIILNVVLISGCNQKNESIEENILTEFNYFLSSDKFETKSILIDSLFNTNNNRNYEYQLKTLKENLNYIFNSNDFDYLKLIFSQKLEKDTLHDLKIKIMDWTKGINTSIIKIEDFLKKQNEMHLRMKNKTLILKNKDFSLDQSYWLHEGDTLNNPILNDKPYLIELNKSLVNNLSYFQKKVIELRKFINNYQVKFQSQNKN